MSGRLYQQRMIPTLSWRASPLSKGGSPGRFQFHLSQIVYDATCGENCPSSADESPSKNLCVQCFIPVHSLSGTNSNLAYAQQIDIACVHFNYAPGP